MINKIIILLGFVSVLLPSVVLADVIFPGPNLYKSVGYCFEISNIDDYPDYTFIAHPLAVGTGHKIIKQGDCISFYKFSRPTVYAIKNTDFDKNSIGTGYENEKNYFETNTKLIPSGIEISSIGYIDSNNPLKSAVDVFSIVSLTDNGLEIEKSKVIYTYTDGTTEEKAYLHDTRPEPSRKLFVPSWFTEFWYIILPILAAIVIVIILLLRRRK